MWKELAIGLKQVKAIRTIGADSEESRNREIDNLIDLIAHWIANDQEKSWKKLVDAVEMCKEKIVAKKLAKDVGVLYSGAFILHYYEILYAHTLL